MIFDLSIDEPTRKDEIKLVDILKIDDDVEEVTDTLNVFDLCKVPFFYSGDKHEMLSWLQPYSTDVAMTEIGKDWKESLTALCEILNFRSLIYIIDESGYHDSKVENFMHRHGFAIKGEKQFLNRTIFEYSRNSEHSYFECFNEYYNIDVFSIILINALEFDTVMYCDCADMIDLLFYALKNDKSVFMPIELNKIVYVTEYLDNKESSTIKINDNKQFELF